METDEANVQAAARMLQAFACTPQLVSLLEETKRELAALRSELTKRATQAPEPDAWLDAKGAAKYLGLSGSSFDKYRYETTPRIPGCKLDGKTLYKRSDLDSFVRLYELKSSGFA